MKRLADRSPLARKGGIIGYQQKAAGLERREQLAISARSTFMHVVSW
jgi:hypothetical protein